MVDFGEGCSSCCSSCCSSSCDRGKTKSTPCPTWTELLSLNWSLTKKAIGFAEKYVTISDDDKELFLHTNKSFLFNNNQPWVKKENPSCDVTIGSYDGAETCELVDL